MGIFIRFIKHSLSGPDRWNILSALAKYFLLCGIGTLLWAIQFLFILTYFFKDNLGYGQDFEFPLIVKILIVCIIWLPFLLGIFCADLVKMGCPLENKILYWLAMYGRVIFFILPLFILLLWTLNFL